MAVDFGGKWTAQKLNALEEYLQSYSSALKKQNFVRIYIDAFAGRGGKPADAVPLFDPEIPSEAKTFARGSVRRALDLELPFDRYVFIDRDHEACASLKAIVADFPKISPVVEVKQADANTALTELVTSIDWDGRRGNRHRGVAFVDPYACQMNFSTIELLAATKAIDVWILFPTMAINRLLASGGVRPEWKNKLAAVFGVTDWDKVFYQLSGQAELFGYAARKEKRITPEMLEDYYGRRLSEVFEGGVAEAPLRLSDNTGHPLFALFFACANPSARANELAKRLAQNAIRNASSNIKANTNGF